MLSITRKGLFNFSASGFNLDSNSAVAMMTDAEESLIKYSICSFGCEGESGIAAINKMISTSISTINDVLSYLYDHTSKLHTVLRLRTILKQERHNSTAVDLLRGLKCFQNFQNYFIHL